jgi:starch phosphorylase
MAIETLLDRTAVDGLDARKLPRTLQPLERLAQNYWWSWAADGPGIFRDLDADVWQSSEQNPRALLAEVSELSLAQMATDPVYVERVRRLAEEFAAYMSVAQAWPQLHLGLEVTPEHPVAYFCAEYGIHNSLPVYSGGLGILAGDHLKSASDLRLPLVAVGLLYRFGYFRQVLRIDGWQEESYRETYPGSIPVQLVKEKNGAALEIEVAMRDRTVRACAWRVDVGHVRLYLLDTNIDQNEGTDRWVTGHLYGGNRETRMVQEMMLGIGGVRLLRALEIQPSAFHLNEGHSAFLTLELSREAIEADRIRFAEAAASVRRRCVFTTHTPVAAGNDEFDVALIDKCFGNWHETALGISRDEFLALGRVNGDPREQFGLTPLAIRMCRSTNGVSRKHGEVSRRLWQGMWPGRSADEVPITSITNGVHPGTWVAPLMRSLYERYLGAGWAVTARDGQAWSAGVETIPDQELWEAHCLLKQRLVAFVRHHAFQSRVSRGEDHDYVAAARTVLDPEVLTIGFARRVAGYKRWELVLSDPERLKRMINHPERPVQFVFAGKAHPQDEDAKRVLQCLSEWRHDPAVRQRLAFIADYDQEIARQLVQSVDVWMNVPRRPFEASGTSGQKAAMNGGVNFSVLDGWWMEGYSGDNGFAIGSVDEAESVEADPRDAESMYRLLEEEITRLFYGRDAHGIPSQWLRIMKRSIQTLLPAFNSDRMVAEYAERIYS